MNESRSSNHSDDPAIVAEGLVRVFGDVRAVDGVDLAVGAGEIYGFLGPNASRALLLIPRDIEGVVPALIIPVFFFVVNVGSLQSLTESVAPGFDYKAFQLPVAIIFAVTGISRAPNLVTDIRGGYFDRVLVTPMSRQAFLLGLMVADFTLVVALCLPVIALGLALGVSFESGPVGIVVFVLIAGLWGLVFTGFPYAIALKTGSPAAVNSSFLLFFPFAFLTTSFVPEDQLTGWLATIAIYNPVTYILEALRSLIFVGWDAEALAQGLAAIAAVGVLSQFLAFAALRGRIGEVACIHGIEDAVSVAHAEVLEVGRARSPKASAAAIWPLDDLAATYREFNDRYRSAVRARQRSMSETIALTLAITAAFEHCVARDPLLPPELLPARWPGRTARQLIAEGARRLAEHESSMAPTGFDRYQRFLAQDH